MRVYLDTCVIIDYLSKREPFFDDAKEILNLIADNKVFGFVSSSSITDIHYIINHFLKDEELTRNHMINILSLIDIISTYSYNIKTIFDSPINDFEDALVEELSYQLKLDYIITRNFKDFKNSRIEILTPKEFLDIYNSL